MHYSVLVLVPNTKKIRENVEETVESMLAPFNEELAIVTEEEECYCGKRDKETGETVFSKDCDECDGTGEVLRSYNPNGRWDWWEIGGRWDGLLTGYDPYKDPQKYSICTFCHGSGNRGGMISFIDEHGKPQVVNNGNIQKEADKRTKGENCLPEEREKILREIEKNLYPELKRTFIDEPQGGWGVAHSEDCNGCNVCHGSGISFNSYSGKDIQKNAVPVAEIKISDEILNGIYAVVTPDGTWRDVESLEIDDKEEEDKDWRNKVKEILEENKDKFAILCDLHQ